MTLATFLANGALFGSVLCGLALLLSAGLRKRPDLRCALLGLALAAIAAWPAIVVGSSYLRLGRLPAAGPVRTASVTPYAPPTSSAVAARPAPERAPLPKPAGWSWPAVIAFVWGAGAFGVLSRIIREWRRSRRLLANSTEHEDRRTESLLARHRLRGVYVRESDEIDAPAAVFAKQRCVLLPAGLSLEDAQLEAVLLHESAHLTERHDRWVWIHSLAVAMLWWNPLVYVAVKEADQALEEVCDDFTVRVQKSGEPLACALVALAQECRMRAPKPMLTVFKAGGRIERRVRRLLEKGDRPMMTNRRLSLMIAGVLGTASVGVAITMTTSGMLQATFGLKPGIRWVYSAVSGDGARTDLLYEVLGFKKVAGRQVAEIHVASGGYGHYAYLGAHEGGLYRYQNSRLGDHPGIYEGIPPRELLRAGLKEGESWSWEEDILYQTAGKVSEEQERAERRKHRLATTATIEAVGKPFHTPAGDFSVTVVRYDSKSEALGRETIRRWISLDVGIVREESGSGENRRVMELVRYDPAR